jgi:hypothetical protein
MEAEWAVLAVLMETAPDPVVQRVRRAISGYGWFVFLARRGVLERWLAEDATAELALGIMEAGQSASPDLAAELLADYRHRSPAAANGVAEVLHRSNLADSRKTFELFIDLLDADDPSLSRRDFFYLAHDLHKQQPVWGSELIGAYLRNRLRAADAADVINPFRESIIPRQLFIHELVDGSARGAPLAFLDHVLPQMMAIIERTATPQFSDETEPISDEVWHAAERHGRSDGLDDDLLSGMAVAMQQLATSDEQRFLDLVAEQCDTEYETVSALLFEGFRARPEDLADIAIDFVLTDHRRLSVGRSSDDHWATRELMQAVAPHCSREHLERLEAAVLDHFTPWERSKPGYKSRGYAQFTLLEAIPRARLSDLGRRRLGEWQRKFEMLQPYAPRGVTGGMVGSPIQSSATRKMNDQHWLRAFERYNSTDSDSRNFLKGGAHQLSQELEARANEDPVRFVGLAGQMPDDVHTYYFDALLRGVGSSEQEIPIDATRALIQRCHALPGRPSGRWIAQPLRRHRDAALPLDLAEVLTWYATRDPDPPAVSDNFSGDISDAQRIEMQGLNSVRGSIANEIADHVSRHEDNVAPFEPAIEALVRDRSAPVRGMTIRTLTGLMRHRPERAVELFVELTSHPEDLILAGREAHEFLRFAGGRHFTTVRPVIERMLQSESPAVQTGGAIHASLAAFDNPDAARLAETCLGGDPALRVGVARVAAANVHNAPDRAQCELRLISLFHDGDQDVRKAAGDVFKTVADNNFNNGQQLVEAFIASPAFDADGAAALLAALDRAEAPPAATSLQTCCAYLDAHAATGTDTGGMALHDAGELALRAYAGAHDLAGQNSALDVVDRVLELDAFRLNRSLAEYER